MLLLLLLTFSSSDGLRCWVCRSDTDPRCSDPFDNRSLPITDCDTQTLKHLKVEPLLPGGPMRERRSTMCRKMRQKVEGQWRTIRNCAFLGRPGEGTGNENHCLVRHGTHDIYTEYCTCDSRDGCNGAPSLSILSILTTTITTLFATTFISLFQM
ncbi:hypothetical protein HDE_11542 [Halotydeus destructor]|nr:hypothetical protein HDE_11542 [Halotydeus destructor]